MIQKFFSDLELFGIKLGLEQVGELLEYIGNPQLNLKFIHIAGSNGKGSVAALLASSLKSAGFRTGFYSSPHLVSVRERFRINGKAISEKELGSIIEKITPFIEKMRLDGKCPTYFEVTTVIAVLYFFENNVDFVIWETGMGGRFDATNVVDPICSVITGISVEHSQYLGDTIEKIAFEKAGIIKKNRPVFAAELPEEARKLMQLKAAESESEFFQVNSQYEPCDIKEKNNLRFFKIKDYEINLALYGKIQLLNASLAFMVLEYLSELFSFDMKQALKGFAAAKWPGRFQVLPDGTMLDGAHNPDGIQHLREWLSEKFPGEKFPVIFSSFPDKDTKAVLEELIPFASEFIFISVKGNRPSRSPEELSEILQSISPLPFSSASVEDALTYTHGKNRLVTGSLYLVGEVLKSLLPEEQIINI